MMNRDNKIEVLVHKAQSGNSVALFQMGRKLGDRVGALARNQGKRRIALAVISSMIVLLAYVPSVVTSQNTDIVYDTNHAVEIIPLKQASMTYSHPDQKMKFTNYMLNTFGPYPASGAMIAAGVGQFSNSPPEWKQSSDGFMKRFASDYAISAVETTTHYGLAQMFKEDTLYYRCECIGYLPRFSHASLSTLSARQESDGHRVFSLSALVSPYVGTLTGVYGWYPHRYGVKDAFRMGNYSMLRSLAGNVTLEFIYSGPHSLLAHIYMNNRHGSMNDEPRH